MSPLMIFRKPANWREIQIPDDRDGLLRRVGDGRDGGRGRDDAQVHVGRVARVPVHRVAGREAPLGGAVPGVPQRVVHAVSPE